MNLDTELSLILGLEEDGTLVGGDDDAGVGSGDVELYDEASLAITDPIDKLEQSMGDLADAQVGMEEIYGAVSAFLEKGGMDQPTANLLHIAVSQACNRFPLAPVLKMPGTESYEEVGGRMAATLEGLEEAEGWFKSTIDWIQAMIGKFVVMIKNLWSRWTLSASGVAKKANAIRAAIKASNLPDATSKISVSETDYRNLSVGSAVSASSIVTGLSTLSVAISTTGGRAGTDTLIDAYTKMVTDSVDKFRPTGEAPEHDKWIDVEAAVKMFSSKSGITYTESAIEAHEKEGGKNGSKFLVSKEFIGNKHVVVKFKGSNGWLSKVKGSEKGVFKGINVSLTAGPSAGKISGKSTEMAAISMGDGIKICTDVALLCSAVGAAKVNSGARDTALKAIKDAVAKIKGKMNDDKIKKTDPALYQYIKAYLTACSTLPSALYNPGTELSRHGLIVSKSALNLVILSMRQAKKDKDKKD